MERKDQLATIFALFSKWRRLLLINFLVFAALGVTISLILPKWYKAVARIIPAETASPFNPVLSFNPFTAGGFKYGASGTELLTYVGILKSRTVREATVRNFNLDKRWKCRDMDDALQIIEARVKVGVDDEGLIYVEGWDKHPKLAADITNYIVEQLIEVNTRLSIQNARANRIFLEGRVNEMMAELGKAEETLRDFQEKNGAYALSEQTRVMIETAAELQAQIYSVDVTIQVLKGSVKKDHPELLNKRLELDELKRKLKTLETATPSDGRAEFQIPFDKIPQVGLQYIRLLREVEKYQKILEFLIPQLEQARFDEVKETPVVQVLDYAQPPARKAKPVRSRITLAITLMGILLTAGYILLVERWSGLRQQDKKSYHQIRASWKAIKADLFFWRKLRSDEASRG